jgi:phosphatidylserine/phosphatidylglycerophosphate/cardiolipin synthase-like enzyme
MIRLTISPMLEVLLQRLEQQPERFRDVLFVAPFLEFQTGRSQERWRRILTRLCAARAGVTLVTRERGSAAHGQNIMIFNQAVPTRPALFMQEIHAKLYIASGRDKHSSLCLMTSANLSDAAILGNLETSMFLEPPFHPSELAHVDKMLQVGDLIVQRALSKRRTQDKRK